MAIRYLTGTATQGSADAFVQGEISTGLEAIGNIAYRLRELLVRFPNMVEVDNDVEVSLTRKSFTATPAVTERSLIWKQVRQGILTTSGLVVANNIEIYQWPKDFELLIVEDPIYIQLDSSGTSASNGVTVRIAFEQVRISETDRLQIIANTLSS